MPKPTPEEVYKAYLNICINDHIPYMTLYEKLNYGEQQLVIRMIAEGQRNQINAR